MKYIEPVRTRVGLAIFLLIVAQTAFSVSAHATTVTTNDTIILPTLPLIVSAYEAQLTTATTDAKGKVLTQWLTDVSILELYNSGDVPLSLKTLHIYDAADTARELQFNNDRQGYVLPGEHVALASPKSLSGTTYTISGWSAVATKDATTPGIELMFDGYRSARTDIKVSDVLEKRSFGVSSYLTSFTDAVSTATVDIDAYLTDTVFDDGLYSPPHEPTGLEVSEVYAYASDCVPFDTSAYCSDFIELHNTSLVPIDLTDIVLRTDSNSSSRTDSNTFTLRGRLEPDAYALINRTDDGNPISLTNSGGHMWLEDAFNLAPPFTNLVVSWPSFGSETQGLMSYIPTDASNGVWTTTVTVGFTNVITAPVEEVVVCPAGKYLNPDTNRCRSIEEAVNALAACPEGQERNPATNRCRAKVTAATSLLTPCAEGQERNPATNRCRSIASVVAELIPCDEGQERNPATNRCRKIAGATTAAAITPGEVAESSNPTWNIVTWSLIAVAAGGAIAYGAYEWRHELAGVGRSIAAKFGKK